MRCTGLEKPPEGDIISEYKWLFIGFVILQVTNWSLALLEVFRVVGPLAYAAMEQTFPLDVRLHLLNCSAESLLLLHRRTLHDRRGCVRRKATFQHPCNQFLEVSHSLFAHAHASMRTRRGTAS